MSSRGLRDEGVGGVKESRSRRDEDSETLNLTPTVGHRVPEVERLSNNTLRSEVLGYLVKGII